MSDEMVSVARGSEFEIRLGFAPSTGYTWQPRSLPAGVEMIGSDTEMPAGAAPGDPGVQILRMLATDRGEFAITFDLVQRWEPVPIESHSVTVHVV